MGIQTLHKLYVCTILPRADAMATPPAILWGLPQPMMICFAVGPLAAILLQVFFEDNPRDLQVLRHDRALQPKRVQPHLKHVPSYLG